MNIFLRIHDRLTGVLGRDCEGKAVRKGDLVEPAPHVPRKLIGPAARCQMTAVRCPNKADIDTCGESVALICINPDGVDVWVKEWGAIRKVPKSEQDARWENVERITGWKPRTAEQPSEEVA
ncbi:hypothetical protein [Halomonas caseinilytica]|uniref:Uncharacterized protein n=1 Tax=Halomonas caseinilytica TaxID=438744 RepID=A0A1M6T8I9_9GAMM|nr:hypothetical protein [Halomonas caseinilytica]SHK53088.1 hypothetical protein SAMN05192556_103246 [Halomonas caseinilytica]